MVINKSDNTVQNLVYKELRKNILSLQLKPGKEMSTQEVATALNVSRTPVREAFIRLQREGLVDTLPQRGTFVSKINLDRVEQERFIREGLEIAVAEPFVARCQKQHIVQLEEYVEKQSRLYNEKKYAEFVDCDNEFHSLFFIVAGQELAWETIASMNGHYNRIRVLTVSNEMTISGVLKQHKELIELIKKRDAKAFKDELTKHIKKTNFEIPQLIKQYEDYFYNGDELKLSEKL